MKTPSAAKAARSKTEPTPEFIARAERAFKKVGQQVLAECKRYGLKPLVWKD